MPKPLNPLVVLISCENALQGNLEKVIFSRKADLLIVENHSDTFPLLRTPNLALILFHLQRRKSDLDDLRALRKILDQLSRKIPLLVLSDQNDTELALELFHWKHTECLERPLDLSRLAYLCEVHLIEVRQKLQTFTDTTELVQCEEGREPFFYEHQSPLGRIIEQVKSLGPQSTTILLTGETGTGKTRLARRIHQLSPRRNEPFIVVNCGSLSANVIESELFGHLKGAFTGADRTRVGKLQAVGGGTLFLDEVNVLSLELQAKLLQVVDERVFCPVGSNEEVPFQARLIVATNRDLAGEVGEGHFRSDLYYRLNVIEFTLPPLRSQPRAIRSLAEKFLAQMAEDLRRPVFGLSQEAAQALEAYPWPGNIRELSNVIERVVSLSAGPLIEIEDLPERFHALPPGTEPKLVTFDAPAASHSLVHTKEEAEAHYILEALKRNNNNRQRTAAELGISRMTLYTKLRRYGLSPA